MTPDELGQIVHRVWEKEKNRTVGWEELTVEDQECDRQIGLAVQKAILEQFNGQLVSFEGEGFRMLGSSNDIPELLKFVDVNLPETSYERPHILNLLRTVQQAINGYKFSETKTLSKLKSFKEDVLTYLRAIALVAETVGNATTHREKDSRLRGLIGQIESAIQNIRDEQEKFVNSWWQTPDLFRSDYPVKRYMERIQELEIENKKLKGEPVEDNAIF